MPLSGTFTTLEECEEYNQGIVNNLSCEIEMSLLKNYEFVQGDQIIFKVAAHNLVGWSDYSDPNSAEIALMVVQPHKPVENPQRDDVLTSDILLRVTWNAVQAPLDGGDDITSYNL